MLPYLSQNSRIAASRCDNTAKLGIPDCFQIFMDLATDHANALEIGMSSIGDKGLFWLTVKTKIKFFRRPDMNETVSLMTWPEKPERLRCNRDYLISSDDEVLVAGKTQWAVMDMNSGTLHSTADLFPANLEILDKLSFEDGFSRIPDKFDTEPFAQYIVRSTDIDLGQHMNNAAYIRAFAGLFSTEEWNAMNIGEIEVQYKSSCYEGDILFFQKKENENETQYRASLEDGKTVLLISVK